MQGLIIGIEEYPLMDYFTLRVVVNISQLPGMGVAQYHIHFPISERNNATF